MAVIRKKTSPYGIIKFSGIEEYHASFPEHIQKILEQLKNAIKQVAPLASETISYNIPTFKQNKNLVHYAVFKEHIGFYPTPGPLRVFKNELEKYKTSKGAIQFPLNKPLPLALIKKIVKYRVKEDQEKIKSKKVKSNQNKL